MASKASIFNVADFRGGYFTDIPSSQLTQADALVQKNSYWENGLRKRKGYNYLATVTASGLLGGIRAKVNDQYQWIVACKVATTSGPSFYSELRIGTSGAALSTITGVASVACTTGDGSAEWMFDVLGDQVVGVNGVDKPRVIYAGLTATVLMDTIEHYDKRTRDNDNWVAGQFNSAGYTDDTTDAQDAGSTDFVLASTSISSGFYVGSDFTFNRVNFVDVEAAGATTTMTYEYYGRTGHGSATLGWQSFTPTEVPTWTSLGNHALEFSFPIGSDGAVLMEKLPTDTATLDGKYAIRAYTTATTTASIACAYATVEHNQYLSQLWIGQTPNVVAQHKNHLFLGIDNWARVSPANSLQGWRYQDFQYFFKGGSVKKMLSTDDRLIVFLQGHTYAIAGNSWSNWVLEDYNAHGTPSKYGATELDGEIYYVGTDGYIRKLEGRVSVRVSKHIKTDIDSFTLASTVMMAHKGLVYIGNPATDEVLVFDPDTFRSDPEGDGRVSFFKWTNFPVNIWTREDAEAVPYFLSEDSGGTPRIFQADVRDDYDTTVTTNTVPIAFEYRSPYLQWGTKGEDKQARRVKLFLNYIATATCGTTTFAAYKQGDAGLATHTVSFTLPAGTSIEAKDFTIPHTIDGSMIGFSLLHNSAATFKLIEFSVEMRRRGF